MKTRTLFIAFIFSLSFSAFSQQTEATLQETTDWITKKINNAFFWYDGKNFTYETFIRFEGCKCQIIYDLSDFRDASDRYVSKFEFNFSFSDVAINSLAISDFEGEKFKSLSLYIYNNQKLIERTFSKYQNSVFKNKRIESTDGFWIPIEVNENLTKERYMKAFTHLLKLCGAKAEEEEKF